jgi:NAD(P)-dependent dehydrogenase (short-subunit alcohol dehydrogenase family)
MRINMKIDLSGKTAIITGSSRGIGSAIALELAGSGAEIIVHCARDRKDAEAVAGKIAESGGKCRVVQADLSGPQGAEHLMEQVGSADILVLNASVQYRRPWEQITREEYEIQMNCNLWSSMRLSQLAVPSMRQSGWGRIVAVGSVQEAKPHPDMLVYSASKSAQTTMVKSLALQLAGSGITVNSVAPGVILTDRNVEALADEAYAKNVLDTIPVGFFGEKEDCAGIVCLLCSEYGRYITGQSIYVDGGKSLA